MFIAASFIIPKPWKYPKCPSVHAWIKNAAVVILWFLFRSYKSFAFYKKAVVHVYNGILLGHKKEQNLPICNYIDGPREYYAK